MSPGTHHKQLLLFLAAVLLPCLVLVALTLRLASQQRELAQKREAEDRQSAVREIHEQLLSKLEVIESRGLNELAGQQATRWPVMPGLPPIVLIAPVEGSQLLLPWDADASLAVFRQATGKSEFERKVQEGIRAEFTEGKSAQAGLFYGQAEKAAQFPPQSAEALLLLARASFKSGRRAEALALERRISRLPLRLRDDQGVPFALYAATELPKSERLDPAFVDKLRSEVESRRWLPPAEAYMLRDLSDALAGSAKGSRTLASAQHLHREAVERVNLIERVLALRNDLPGLIPLEPGERLASGTESLWIPYGPEPWLVTLAPPAKGLPRTLVVVHGHDLFKSIQEDRANIFSRSFQAKIDVGGQGELLGAAFPGLRVQLKPVGDSGPAHWGKLESSLYVFILVLVLSVTFFGAYFVWRDVRRELQLAALRSQFVSSVSHELRTPLAAIRMFAETLRMGRTAGPETQAEYLDTIVNESERLTRLLDNVLDFSKIERGERSYKRVPVLLAGVIQEAARALQYPLSNQGFNLQVEIDDRIPPIPGDPDAIEQAVLNLLTNAMKYSPDKREIDLRLLQANGDAVIQVADHGIGIPASEHARIFEKFYRIPTSENQQVPGTGLGLTLVDHIARAHGGRVEVESSPGKGSTFSIILPLEKCS